jgi:hypothetical protein
MGKRETEHKTYSIANACIPFLLLYSFSRLWRDPAKSGTSEHPHKLRPFDLPTEGAELKIGGEK